MRFQHRILASFIPWIVVCFAVLLGIVAFLETRQIRNSVENNLSNISKSIQVTIESSTRIYRDQLSAGIRVTEDYLGEEIRLSSVEFHEYDARNQITKEVSKVSLPAFETRHANGQWQLLEEAFAGNLTRLLGGTVTIFQKFDKGLLRVSTSVKQSDGTVATGTYIPEDSPVYAAITSGNPYTGRAFVVNDWYFTWYNPIFNDQNVVIGATYVGVSQLDLNFLRDVVTQFHSVESYYSAVMDIEGNLIIHPKWPGENVSELNVEGLQEAFLKIRDKILVDKESHGRVEYDLEGRRRINYFTYAEATGWITLSGVDKVIIRKMIYRYLLTTFGVLIIALTGLTVLIWSLSNKVARPIRELRVAVAKLSLRDFDFDLPSLKDDDTRKLGMAFQRMAKKLKQFTHDLELKVEERTKELSQKRHELQIAHNEAVEAITALEDEIKQRKTTEQLLHENESQYRSLISNLPGILVRCEPAPPFKVTFVSDNLIQMGLSDPSGFLIAFNTGISVIAADEDKELVLGTFAKSLETREPFHIDFRFCTEEQKEGWFSMRGSAVESDGSIVSVDCVVFEITKQREADKRLSEALQQQAEQRGKLEMSSSVLHDIGNAVTNVGTTVSHLATDNHWPEVDELKRLIKFIESQRDEMSSALGQDKYQALIEFLMQLVKSFKDRSQSQHESFVKLSAIVQHVTEILHLQRRYSMSAGVNRRESLDIHVILQDALSIFSGSIEKRNISIKSHFGNGVSPIVGDHTRILQVFINILKNACEAIDARRADHPDAPGEITISIDSVDSGYIDVAVHDSGIGFEKSVSVKFFKRGFTTKASGSGIGLDQCHQILRAHGGTFTIESDGPMTGATVTARFPVNP